MSNKTNKGEKMRKIVMVIGLLSMLASSANAGTWTHTPSFGGGFQSTYTPSYNSLMGGWY
jgi:hypothetical protein